GLFPYDVSKSCADLLCRSFAHTYDLPVSTTRSANIYGPADINLSRVIPGTIVSLLKDESPIIRSDGTPIREFIHVDDVVAGYLAVAENIDMTRGEAFNLGTNEPIGILDLVNKIIRLSGRENQIEPTVMLSRKIDREIDAQYLSAEKIEATLGWKPSINMDEGLTATIDWYSDHITVFT
ncbi:MAG TPA: NAD-dependent epimerase/dehydratase family protein, partial [Pyrinomonadaceae bacterium]|nr:NAD-dependent epimerase/dehydratase family protein [Pyrinomonadaceae bacterium]